MARASGFARALSFEARSIGGDPGQVKRADAEYCNILPERAVDMFQSRNEAAIFSRQASPGIKRA